MGSWFVISGRVDSLAIYFLRISKEASTTGLENDIKHLLSLLHVSVCTHETAQEPLEGFLLLKNFMHNYESFPVFI
jgi:hypothetical protein